MALDNSLFQIKNEKLLDELETYYSYVLDSSNLNLADPIAANIGFFNNSGKVWVDGPKLGRTLVYITRPNMNFRSPTNILKCRAFNYIMSSKMGITLARQLMYSKLAAKVNYGGYDSLNMKETGGLVAPLVTHNPDKEGVDLKATKEIVGGEEVTEVETGGVWSVDKGYVLDDTNFITLLSNTCTETGSAKDLVLDVDETEGDYSGNKLVYGAGLDESTGPGEITLTFEDLYGSPVMNMMIMWVYYIHYVTKGICVPYYEYIVNRIIDYTCSIYVFMLDTDQQTILRWVKYCGAFPKTIPFGQILHTKEPNLQALSQIQIPFQYNFCCPNDPAVLAEFNMLSEPAICNRAGEWSDKETCSNLIFKNFFKGKNHIITEEEALRLMQNYPPKKVPTPLLKAKNNGINMVHNVRDGTPISLYENIGGSPRSGSVNSNYIWGDYDNYFYGPRLSNRYYGMIDPRRNVGQPYIVGGNKLMFI